MNKPNSEPPQKWSQFTIVPAALLNSNQYTPKEYQLKGIEQLTLIHLMSYAFGSTIVFPSQERLSNDIGITRKSIGRHIQTLVTKGWINKERQGHKLNNCYDLAPAFNILVAIDRNRASQAAPFAAPRQDAPIPSPNEDDF